MSSLRPAVHHRHRPRSLTCWHQEKSAIAFLESRVILYVWASLTGNAGRRGSRWSDLLVPGAGGLPMGVTTQAGKAGSHAGGCLVSFLHARYLKRPRSHRRYLRPHQQHANNAKALEPLRVVVHRNSRARRWLKTRERDTACAAAANQSQDGGMAGSGSSTNSTSTSTSNAANGTDTRQPSWPRLTDWEGKRRVRVSPGFHSRVEATPERTVWQEGRASAGQRRCWKLATATWIRAAA